MLVYKFHNILALLIQQTPFYDRYQKDGCSVILLSSSVFCSDSSSFVSGVDLAVFSYSTRHMLW